MSILDGLMGQVDGIAEKLGLDPEQAKSVVSSLGEKLSAGGDKTEALKQVAEENGLSLDSLQSMLGGDDGIMGKVTGFLDRDGDGNPLNDLTGMAKGLFGGKE